MSEPRTWTGPDALARQRILRETRTVAIVGASANPSRASYFVWTYLKSTSDYDVYLVNPTITEVDGTPVYPSLAELPVVPDLVDVFRRHDDLPSVLDDTVAVGAKTIWLQLGLWHEQVAARRRGRGPAGGDGPVPEDRARPVPRRASPRRVQHRRDRLATALAAPASPPLARADAKSP